MKYIVTKNEEEVEEIFIFPESVHHDCMAEILDCIRNQSWGNWRRVGRKAISAGFIKGGLCTGRSESLSLSSRPQDSLLLPWKV